jgi:hypothetical protein
LLYKLTIFCNLIHVKRQIYMHGFYTISNIYRIVPSYNNNDNNNFWRVLWQ